MCPLLFDSLACHINNASTVWLQLSTQLRNLPHIQTQLQQAQAAQQHMEAQLADVRQQLTAATERADVADEHADTAEATAEQLQHQIRQLQQQLKIAATEVNLAKPQSNTAGVHKVLASHQGLLGRLAGAHESNHMKRQRGTCKSASVTSLAAAAGWDAEEAVAIDIGNIYLQKYLSLFVFLLYSCVTNASQSCCLVERWTDAPPVSSRRLLAVKQACMWWEQEAYVPITRPRLLVSCQSDFVVRRR